MVVDVGPRTHAKSNAALFRAIGIGALVGVLSGSVVGTLTWPVVGTFFGALIGALVGALYGLVNGLVLAGIVEVTTSRWIPAALCALTTLLGTACLVSVGHGWTTPSGTTSNVVFITVCTLLAAALGPIAGHGARPIKLGRRIGQRRVSTVIKTALLIGAVGGGSSGALLGAGLGLESYPPTAAAAAIEGCVLGAVSGAAACLLLATLLIAPKLRVRR
jgi:hypothetical protein